MNSQLQPDVGDVGHPELVDAGGRHPSRQVRIDRPSVVGICRHHHELPPAQTKQVILAHDPVNSLVVHAPSAIAQLARDARPAVTGELDCNPLDLVPQIQVPIDCFRSVPPAVESGPAHQRQPAQPLQRNGCCQIHFLFEVREDELRISSACSFRCSSTCCKQRRKKSISSA